MKKLLLFASSLLLSLGNATAMPDFSDEIHCRHDGVSDFAPMDSTRTKLDIKKMEIKKSDTTQPQAKEVKNTTTEKVEKVDKGNLKPLDSKAEINLKESKPLPAQEKNASEGKSTSIDEIKATAKSDSKAKTPAAKETIPAVSYPYYPGGNIAIREFVRKNQQYPPECKRERLRGRVEVMIAIAPDGTPHSATISKSSGNVHMDAEALRIAELMPRWNAAPESEDPQGIDYVIFVNFRPGR